MDKTRKKLRKWSGRLGMVIMIGCFLIGAGSWYHPVHSETAGPEPPQLSAHAAALIDVETGRILYSKNGREQNLIASLTKIMTAVVAIEHGNLSDRVKVGPSAYGIEGSSLYLALGERMNLQTMLYGLMLRSGNDAAVAIAEHVGGSVEGFAWLMNRKAEWLGMHHTHFMNPHGLNHERHYSTAIDMAKLAAHALKNPVFGNIVSTKIKKAPNPNEKWDYTWYNKNKMLTLYEGADGVKTGYTKKAGRCLVSSATREGRQLAVVTLNAPDDWADHAALLDYGFEHFPMNQVLEQGQEVGSANGGTWTVVESFRYPLAHKEAEQIRLKIRSTEPGTVAYLLGNKESLIIYLGRKQIGSVAVRPGTASNRPSAAANPGQRGASFLPAFHTLIKELFAW